MSVKIAVCADLHLRVKTWARTPAVNDSFVALKEVMATVKRLECSGVVMAGDLFTSYLSPDIPSCLSELVESTSSVNKIIYTLGNHDKTGAPSGNKNPEWIEVLAAVDQGKWSYAEDIVHDIGGIRCCVVHHTADKDELVDKIKRLKNIKFDMLVMHQTLYEMLSIDDKYDITSEEIAKHLKKTGCKIVVCGHVHKFNTWIKENILFVSPGSTYRCTLWEKESTPMMGVVEFDDLHNPTYHEVKLAAQRERFYWKPVSAEANDIDDRITELKQLRSRVEQVSSCMEPIVLFSYVPVQGVKEAFIEAAGPRVFLDMTPTGLLGAKTTVEEKEDKATDFEAICKRYAEGDALDVLMQVYNGTPVNIAVNEKLSKIMES